MSALEVETISPEEQKEDPKIAEKKKIEAEMERVGVIWLDALRTRATPLYRRIEIGRYPVN